MIDRRKLFTGLVIGTILPLSSVTESSAQKAVGKNENGEPRHNISSYRYQKWQNQQLILEINYNEIHRTTSFNRRNYKKY